MNGTAFLNPVTKILRFQGRGPHKPHKSQLKPKYESIYPPKEMSDLF